MRVSLLFVGDEVVDGLVHNRNAELAKRRFSEVGVPVVEVMEVRDQLPMIEEALRFLLSVSDAVVVCGGLGPTEDDLTREAISAVSGRPLVFDEALWGTIERRIKERGREPRPGHRRMACVLQGGEYAENPVGLAPGIAVSVGEKRIFALPGVPSEFAALLGWVISSVVEGEGQVVFRVFKTVGLLESQVNELVRDAVCGFELRWGTVLSDGEVWVNVKADPEVMALAEPALRRALGINLYGCDDDTLEQVVGGLLRERGLTLATAESCTGGLVANLITNVSGSSDYFKGGVVSYLEEVKASVLGVSWETIREHTVYSHEVAREMALGARRLLGADVAVSTTGIAGPTGGTEEKPVGLVYVGICAEGLLESFEFRFSYDRVGNKMAFAKAALDVVRRYLLGDEAVCGG